MSSSPLTQENQKPGPDKPEILKNSKTKLFILLLCVVSFYAGWQASRSHLVKECQLAGAQVTVEEGLVICQMPQ
ncbi:MAG TPA: hypothetical protein DCQ89_07655 [Psychrobacter sp.]|uniref:Uncharacterized protein n=1 Tax=Psychrobacter pasteurii TaxID=1945520 RepID=A0A1R4EEC7_9GAMM|nr:hypothetical protein [Psychrobacter pasteurii]SJM36837.1 hypothetical protein A1019T_00804 [Psychrobacter pasteurii]HAO60170.1 hypothetical protein [Psychrobacter sp.]HJH08532.1 hypothetical protein [Psychrobacter pasteurii]